jgi:hypothetical protein
VETRRPELSLVTKGDGRPRRREAPRPTEGDNVFVRRGLAATCVCNDPSAGSPTETLLRLLLPLNDKV